MVKERKESNCCTTFSFILMDINMPPGIDGFAACKQIKEISGQEQTKVVACTAMNRSQIEDQL